MWDAVQNAELVIEAGPEKLEIKQAIFAQLSELTPDTAILATNTSAIPIHEVSAKVVNRSRVVGTHFWNPPHLVRLVEVVQSDKTALSTVHRTISLLEGVAMQYNGKPRKNRAATCCRNHLPQTGHGRLSEKE